jgi:hypothetical protein
MNAPPGVVLLDFDTEQDVSLWQPVDDGVMGGLSRSSFTLAEPGIARFAGHVSLENFGGFASVRTAARAWRTAGASALALRVRGDGRTYKFTVRTDDGFDGVQYQSRFTPPAGLWVDIMLPRPSFAASFRGRPVTGAAALDLARARALGLMISDRQAGPFELFVDRIVAVSEP